MTPSGLENMQNYLVPASGTTHGWRFTRTMEPGRMYEVDFRNKSLDGRPFAPSGVLIDNTLGTADFSVIINEFSFRIVCKKGETLMLPYPAPLNQTATLQGEGQVTAIFVDYPVLPFSSSLNSSGGGGGGGGAGGRSKMFHGFQGSSAIQAPASQWTDMPVIQSTIDTDGWQQVGKIVVPAGVELIRIMATTQAMVMSGTPSGRPVTNWQFKVGQATTTVMVCGTNEESYSVQVIDFGVIAVNPGDEILLTGNTPSPDLPVMSATYTIEVLQGDILLT